MKSLSLLLALLFAGAGLRAEQIFVLFDGNCGERVRYEQAIAQQPRLDFYAYQFGLGNGTKLILETGAEGAVTQNYLPQGFLRCGDPRLNLQLADRVNGAADRIFILLPTANQQYLVQPVVRAAVLERVGEDFTYQSPLTGFQFNADNAIIGVNLAYNNPGARVYFEGRDNNACSGVYLFRQLNSASAYPVIDYKLAPEIGILERRLGSDGQTTTGGVIVAREVNGQPVEQYLAAICGRSAAGLATSGYRPVVTANPQAVAAAPVSYDNSGLATPQPYTGAGVAGASTATPVTHTVERGQTLYAISRMYGTSVAAIKASNGLTSDTVYPGQQLSVMTTGAAAATAGAVNPPSVSSPPMAAVTVPQVAYNPGTVATSNPGAAAPTPYNSEAATRGQRAVYGEDAHIVQPGETVASVALKYGFTSAKFREINGLGPNEVIKVGQRLSTSDCNCPEVNPVAPPTNVAPAAYGNNATYGNAPSTYGNAPTTVAPAGYGTQTGTSPVVGTPVGATESGYRAPAGYTAPARADYDPRNPTGAANPATGAATIDNRTSFGEVVPNVSAAPPTTLSNMESRRPTTSPSTGYGNPAPATYGTPAAYGSPTGYGSPAPVVPGSPATGPSTYGGTPVGASVDYRQPSDNVNRAFHLVQEGESLFSISQRYGLSVARLRELNALAPADVIVPFQKLYVN